MSTVEALPPCIINIALIMPVVEERDCVIFWVCPAERLLGCDYGIFAWDEIHETTYASVSRYCVYKTFAENLSKASAKVCMSEDGQRVLMIHMACAFVESDKMPVGLYFEVMQRDFLGALRI